VPTQALFLSDDLCADGCIIETMRTLLEIAVMVLIAALGSLVVGVLFWLLEGRATFSSVGQPWLIALLGVVPTGLVWYATRRHAPYRYREGLVWGVLALFLSLLAFSALTALNESQDALKMTGIILYYGFLINIPALLTVAPLTVFVWHRAIKAMNAPEARA
jgi:hypothetical protein